MNHNETLADQLSALVGKAGGYRKAEQLIHSVRGIAPSKSAIERATKRTSADYITHCMISDLEEALKNDQKEQR